ncbi:MAG: Bug family tripartite tricarboxylate transporter substrate binding protein [Bordetella sp.]|uniref:Bug family tripartite tricarboxylate transporter substrate binding protein n=1 Tax=Bordetella sp. TaxID=28081 RepID=UPI003F7B3E42
MKDKFHAYVDIGRRRLLHAAGAASLLGSLPLKSALAQDAWPASPINYVVPFAPGGLTDVAARMVSKALGADKSWNLIVQNKPGGNANIGAAFVARARPDCYTWLAITMTHAANATLFKDSGYDLLKDLAPLAGLAASPMMVVVNAKSPIKTMADLLKAAKGKRQLTAGSSGNGTPPHLTLALYEKLTGTKLTHVPYTGGAPSLTDLIGGQIDVVFSNYPESLAHVKSGALRALAITTHARSPDVPDVPTVAEAGIPDLIVENFTGIMVPAGTPANVVQQASAAVLAELKKPDMQRTLVHLGFVPQPRGPAEFGKYLATEVQLWRKVIQESGIHTS